MKKTTVVLSVSMMLVIVFVFNVFAEPLIKKFARPGPKPGLYYSGVMVGKTYYVAGTGDGRPESPDESYAVKTKRCFASIQRSLQMANLDLANVVQAWVMLEDPEAVKDMTAAWKETFPTNSPARTTFSVANIPGPSQMEITAIAYSDLSERKIVGPKDLTYSLGVLAGETLYVSGRGSSIPGSGQPETFEEQARQAMKNMEHALTEAGLDFGHVLWSNIYLDSYDNYGVFNKVYSEFFDYGNEPARITVFVEGIPGGNHVEVTCIATTDLASRRIVRPASMKYGPEEMAPTASPGVWAGNTLYLSAQTGYIPGAGIETVDLEKQFHQMMQNHLDVLEEAGLGFEDIVSANVYLRNINDYDLMNIYYPEYFRVNGPGVRTCFQPNHGSAKNDVRVKSTFIMAGERK
ncbi:MAG: RidA family protein [Candidatus Latescibacteria bacterium]|nr:RidA family protein [Candidatus Latescibacterota bacterium]